MIYITYGMKEWFAFVGELIVSFLILIAIFAAIIIGVPFVGYALHWVGWI